MVSLQFPQNTLSKYQAAFSYRLLFEITQDPHYLHLGLEVVDFSSLTQQVLARFGVQGTVCNVQVWSHPNLTPQLLGGCTSQNTDAEWSDARQNYAAIM